MTIRMADISRKLESHRMVLRMIDAQNEPKQPAQPQINPMAALFGAMMQQAAKNQQKEGNPEGSEIESDDDE